MLVCIHETLHMCIYKVYMCVCIYSYKTLCMCISGKGVMVCRGGRAKGTDGHS